MYSSVWQEKGQKFKQGMQYERTIYAQNSVGEDYIKKIRGFAEQGFLTPEAVNTMKQFLTANDEMQRHILDENETTAFNVVYTLMNIIKKVKGDPTILFYALIHLDGMLCENRNRYSIFEKVLEDPNANTKILDILNTFLSTNRGDDTLFQHRNMASNIQSILIASMDVTRFEPQDFKTPATTFMTILMEEMRKPGMISSNALSFSLMMVSKRNYLAKEFSKDQSFVFLSETLEGDCKNDPQVAYNYICLSWILSFHQYTQRFFASHELVLVEKMSKLLDYHNQEKIVRIFLLLID